MKVFFCLTCLALINTQFCYVLVENFESCDPKAKYPFIINITITTVGNKQYADGTIVLKRPVDNNIRSNISVAKFVDKKYVHLFTAHEKKTCDAIHNYLGELAYEIERRLRLIPHMCPIPQGVYHVHRLYLDFEKSPVLGTVPLGKFRVTDNLYDGQIGHCGCWIGYVYLH